MAKPAIGLSMLYCLGEPFKQMVAQITEARTGHIEIVDEGFHALNKQRISTLNDVGESCSLTYSVHAPFADVNIASPSELLLRAMLKRLKQSIAYSNALNATTWVFHPGTKTGISMFYPGMDWQQNLKTVSILVKIAEDYGVRIAIENVPEPFPFLMKSVEDFEKFYAEVDGHIDLALDIGHANLNGQVERFVATFSDRIVHVHAHDNDGKGDQHLGIGYGTVDWKGFAVLIKKVSGCGVIVVESVEHVQESVERIKQLLA